MAYEDLKNLSRIRFEKAEECLSAARDLIGTQNYRGAANRSYYAIFHAMRAVLAYDGIDMQHHSGIISEFRKRYLKTEILDRELSKTISALFDIRTNCVSSSSPAMRSRHKPLMRKRFLKRSAPI